MTVKQCLDLFDARIRNTVPASVKLSWLNALDMKIYETVLKDRTDAAEPEFPYSDPESASELLIPSPYDEAYLDYLEAKRDLYLGDTVRYAFSSARFENSYREFSGHIARNFGYKGKETVFRI